MLYEDLGQTLNDDGLPGVLSRITELIKHKCPTLMVIDGHRTHVPQPRLYLDEWVYDFFDTVQRTQARRVVIDSLGDLSAASGDEIRFREYVYSLLQRCARNNISVTMTLEVPELFGITRLSEFGISHLSDNVVMLQFCAENPNSNVLSPC